MTITTKKLSEVDPASLNAATAAVIAKGSLSFNLASRLLPKAARRPIHLLYTYCRYVDDCIDDEASKLTGQDALSLLADLRQSTLTAMRGQAPAPHQLGLTAIYVLGTEYALPEEYVLELLAGMDMDLAGTRYETLADLQLYCYRVAGVVGVMFAHLLHVSDAKALRHAADLGMAMQLSNIARDVMDDARMGRLYLPRRLLREAHLGDTPEQVLRTPASLAPVLDKLLARADELYHSGEQGLRYLPLQVAAAVAAARYIYADIGHQVRRRGPYAFVQRAVVPTWRKWLLLIFGLARAGQDAAYRLKHPWKKAALPAVWRYP